RRSSNPCPFDAGREVKLTENRPGLPRFRPRGRVTTMNLNEFRKSLRVALLTSLILAVVMVIECSFNHHQVFRHGQLIITFLGIATGAIMALINTWFMPFLPRTARGALGLLAGSQIAFYILVWTN